MVNNLNVLTEQKTNTSFDFKLDCIEFPEILVLSLIARYIGGENLTTAHPMSAANLVYVIYNKYQSNSYSKVRVNKK